MTLATKIGRTFAFAFLGVFIPCLVNIATSLSTTIDWSLAKSALVSGFFAAAAAGARTIVAFLPVFKDDTVGLQKKA